MKKHFITLLLLCLFTLVVASPALARLTLGVVVGQDSTQSMFQREKIKQLTNQLYQTLQEDIVVREFDSSAAILKWLDQFAALDFALLSMQDMQQNKGRFLIVGPLEGGGQINLVARQGIDSVIAKKAADFVLAKGFSPWRSGDDAEITRLAPAVPAPDVEEPPVDLKVKDVETVPAPAQPSKTALVLAVLPEIQGVLRSRDQANRLAEYVQDELPVEIKVKEFADVDRFAEWFMRYRMVDLAVLPKSIAEAKLGRDYIALAELVPGDGTRPPEVLVGRRGDKAGLQGKLRKVLVSTHLSPDGQSLLAGLGVVHVRGPSDTSETVAADHREDDVFSQLYVVKGPEAIDSEVKASPPQDVGVPPTEPARPAVADPEPVPELPVAEQGLLPPEPVVADLLPSVPDVEKGRAQPDEPGVAEVEAVFPADELEAPVLHEQELDIPAAPVVTLPPVEDAKPESPAAVKGTEVPGEETAQVKPVEVVEVSPPVPSQPVEVKTAEQIQTPDVDPDSPAALAQPEQDELPEVAGTPERATGLDTPGLIEQVPVEEPVLAADQVPITPIQPEQLSSSEASTVEPPVEEAIVSEAPTETVVQMQDSQDLAERQQVLEESIASPVPAAVAVDTDVSADIRDDDIVALLGEDSVAAIVAQPEIPQELRPPGIPVVRPRRISEQKPAIDEGLFLTSLPDTIEQREPEEPPQLLPDEEQDPGVIYIIPFVAIMVPKEVNDRIFDKFIDAIIMEGEKLELQFVILKEGLKNVPAQWLAARKYVTGEIYGYVEEAGSTVTDLRAKAKIDYHIPSREKPSFSYLHPVSRLLDRDAASIDDERMKLADDIAQALIEEFLKALNG